jgi:hypothetical protein
MIFLNHTLSTNLAADLRKIKNTTTALWTRYYFIRICRNAFNNQRYLDTILSTDKHNVYLVTKRGRDTVAWRY